MWAKSREGQKGGSFSKTWLAACPTGLGTGLALRAIFFWGVDFLPGTLVKQKVEFELV